MTEAPTNIILMFRSHDRLLALPLATVIEVVPAFELMHTPGVSPALAGMISLRGEVLPVIDVGVLIGESKTILKPQHKFIIAKTSRQAVALLVDTMEDLVDISSCSMAEPMSDEGQSCFEGVVSVEDEMVLVLDIEACSRFEYDVFSIDSDDAIHNLEGQIS